jgi:CheY-like chemotaxis protein
MDEYLQWLLAGFGLCVLVAWRSYRAFKRADAKRKSKRVLAEAQSRAEALRLAIDEASRQQAERRAAAQRAARAAEATTLAQAEAARAEAARLTAEKLARVEAARTHAARAAAAEAAQAARREADDAARAEAAHAEAVRLANEQAARAAAEQAAHREADRQARVDASARAAASSTVAAKTPDQTLIMVADDSKIVRVKTGRLLAQHQYRVFYANDGLDAAQQMQTTIPDVVITDVEMPGMDGFELTRHVRQNPLTAHIPVIMITAADERHREDAKHAGVSVLLGKPYPEEELIAHIRLAMNRGATPAGALV